MDYNVNKKIVNFKDFSKEEEKEELTKVKRSFTKNSNDTQKFPIEELEEAVLYNSETHEYERTPTGLETVGQLIERLKKYDPNTKVAVNVAEEPSEILKIEETIVEYCYGRGDGLEFTTNWNKDEKVILIKGNQY